jgi:hypothetical protein
MDWHTSLMRTQDCSHGDSEFHYGVHRGNIDEVPSPPLFTQF